MPKVDFGYVNVNFAILDSTTDEVRSLESNNITIAPSADETPVVYTSEEKPFVATFSFGLTSELWASLWRLISLRSAWERALARRMAERESKN